MKTINTYINEKLKISKKQKTEYTLFPKNFGDLDMMINKEIEENGNECSLNHIDVSKLTNLSYLFSTSPLNQFNGDISQWDVSNIVNMEGMFETSMFTGENGDISDWDVSNVKNMFYMFNKSAFNSDISQWNVSNVTDMTDMFTHSNFNQDISNWEINEKCYTYGMFKYCPIIDKYKTFKNGKRL